MLEYIPTIICANACFGQAFELHQIIIEPFFIRGAQGNFFLYLGVFDDTLLSGIHL